MPSWWDCPIIDPTELRDLLYSPVKGFSQQESTNAITYTSTTQSSHSSVPRPTRQKRHKDRSTSSSLHNREELYRVFHSLPTVT